MIYLARDLGKDEKALIDLIKPHDFLIDHQEANVATLRWHSCTTGSPFFGPVASGRFFQQRSFAPDAGNGVYWSAIATFVAPPGGAVEGRALNRKDRRIRSARSLDRCDILGRLANNIRPPGRHQCSALVL